MDLKLPSIAGGIPTPSAKKTQSADAGAAPAATAAAKPSEGEASAQPNLRVAELTQGLLAEPAVDRDRVEQVSGQIQSGSYRGDAQRAADNMIRMELSFR
ncbi:flagellar biosynthesis anti-sigma factor FlgM [Methylomagnum ishizawai]|uniref:flagellar biosynthesis anti-sigma factor FlgM n=1 Tax=Methylomagnum ishizawai TaxID=1760988 RepID=UPI001C340AAC|nr:flagellar biosynthesis anti-sigma factor FlgM [Methylomagnum ishizawai]BBL74566.1 hypothetical protein MishRS11D_16640 [Methylomagnum ishizawai]